MGLKRFAPVARLRFTTRAMLLLVAASAVVFVLATPSYLEYRHIQSIKESGGQVYTEPRGFYLLRQFVGDEIAQRAVYVHLKGPHVTDEWLKNLQGLKHIEVLSVRSPNVSDKGLMHLKALPNLMHLNLVDTEVTDAGLQELRNHLPSLKLVKRRDGAR